MKIILITLCEPAKGRFRAYHFDAGTNPFGTELVDVIYGRIGTRGPDRPPLPSMPGDRTQADRRRLPDPRVERPGSMDDLVCQLSHARRGEGVELGSDRMKLLALRHKLQANARAGLDPSPLTDAVIEADECNIITSRINLAAEEGQQATRPRHLRQRPAAGRRDDRTRLGPADAGGAWCGLRRHQGRCCMPTSDGGTAG